MTEKSDGLRRQRLLEIVVSRYDASQTKLAAISAAISDALKRIDECVEELRRTATTTTAPEYAPFVDRRRAALQCERTALARQSETLQSELERRKSEFAALLRQKISLENMIEDAQMDQKRRHSRTA